MFNKIVLIIFSLGFFSLTNTVSYSFQIAPETHANMLITTLDNLKIEKAMLEKGFEFNREKIFLACTPMLLYMVLRIIRCLGDFKIEHGSLCVCGLSAMITYNIFARLIRFVYVLSDIEAIEEELGKLIPQLEIMKAKNQSRQLRSSVVSIL